jgi:hypothetical protein
MRHCIAIALFAVFGLGMTGSPLAAAEVFDQPTQPSDWSYSDRVNFTERWNRANALNLMRGPSGAQEYRTITQRAAFYNWFDQIRKVQKHEIMWPAAAWVVASQMANIEDAVKSETLAVRRAAIGRTVDSDRLLQFAKDGNKAIFDDVFPRLKEVFEQSREHNSYGSNTARQASLRFAFCRRRQEMMARTFGISPAQRR